MPEQEIVRPFELDRRDAFVLERLRQRDPDRKTQAGKPRGVDGRAPSEREQQAAAWLVDP